MSVLRNFFQISMVLMLISIGISFTVNNFGLAMTGQSLSLANDSTTWNDLKASLASEIKQESSSSTIPASVIATGMTVIQNDLLSFITGLQRVIYFVLSSFDAAGETYWATIAIELALLISVIQLVGLIYLVVSIPAIVTGAGLP